MQTILYDNTSGRCCFKTILKTCKSTQHVAIPIAELQCTFLIVNHSMIQTTFGKSTQRCFVMLSMVIIKCE